MKTLIADFITADTSAYEDSVQGAVEVHLTTGEVLKGRVQWISETGEAFGIRRIYEDRKGVWEDADSDQYVATAHVVKIYYTEAGA